MPGLLPTCWGSATWFTIHSIAYTYIPNESNKEKYFSFFENLGYVLPCDECKIHYRQNFNADGLKTALESNDTFFRWTYDLHNLVNKQTGKPKNTWPTFEEVKKRYKNYEVACDTIPGVCGTNQGTPGYNERSTTVVDKVGSITEDSIPYMSVMIVFILITIILVLYIYFKPTKKITKTR